MAAGELSAADIRHFSRWLGRDIDYANTFWAFRHFARQNYAKRVQIPYVDDVCYGLEDKDGGCFCEMMMVWEKIDNISVPLISSFSESFVILTSPMHRKVMQQIMRQKKEYFTPEEFSETLIRCGFRDMSDRRLEIHFLFPA